MYNVKRFDKAVQKLPDLYATDSIKAENKPIAMHLFIGGSDWYICEGNASEGSLFGFACLNGNWQDAEWGYADIAELKALRTKQGFEIDFDLHWKACKFSEIPAIRDNVPGIVCKKEVPLRELLGEGMIQTLKNAGYMREGENGQLIACFPSEA